MPRKQKYLFLSEHSVSREFARS